MRTLELFLLQLTLNSLDTLTYNLQKSKALTLINLNYSEQKLTKNNRCIIIQYAEYLLILRFLKSTNPTQKLC